MVVELPKAWPCNHALVICTSDPKRLSFGHVYRSRSEPEFAAPILLRETYRQNGRFCKRTLCNFSHWPTATVEGLRGALKGGTVIPAGRDAFTVIRSLPHGHVAAAVAAPPKIGLEGILGPDGNRCRDLALAMLISRILDPVSQLPTPRALSP